MLNLTASHSTLQRSVCI